MARRLIDADALIEDIEAAKNKKGMGAIIADTFLRYIKRCRTVKVVECKDCEYCQHKRCDIIGYKDVIICFCTLCSEDIRKVSPWDFCSWGKGKR